MPSRPPASGFAAALLGFYDRRRRDLPWRRRTDPYRTLVSELMLQQTGVATVVPYFERFLARFPDLPALARAEEEEVLALWSGLGYYARGRNLHRTARLVVEQNRGELPPREELLRQLPGLGPYTAAAVAAIGFGERTLPVDGNAARVLARLYGVRDPIDQPAVRAHLRERGQALVPARRCGDFAQAIMELGALVCVPRAPRCAECPLTRWCRAYRSNQQETLPRRSAPTAKRQVALVCAAIERRGRILLVRRPTGTLLGGTWALPSAELSTVAEPTRAAADLLGPLGLSPDGTGRVLGSIRHVFTHRDVTAVVVSQAARGRIRAPARWVSVPRMLELPISSFTRKTLSLLPPRVRR
jgi:A/G-specific adenine glycosylase